MLSRWVAALWLRRCRGPSAGLPLGAQGEMLAARWLQRRGYRILRRNLTLGRLEADLLALDPDRRTLAIVEVKTRSRPHPPPEEAFTPQKIRRLQRVAARLRRTAPYRGRPVRLDAITIVWPREGPPRVRHHVGVFGMGRPSDIRPDECRSRGRDHEQRHDQ